MKSFLSERTHHKRGERENSCSRRRGDGWEEEAQKLFFLKTDRRPLFRLVSSRRRPTETKKTFFLFPERRKREGCKTESDEEGDSFFQWSGVKKGLLYSESLYCKPP